MRGWFPRSFHLALVLLQLFTPWAHAHTGAETMAGLHLPGLEWIGAINGPEDRGSVSAVDIIVGVATGLMPGGPTLHDSDDPRQAGFPVAPNPPVGQRIAINAVHGPSAASIPKLDFHAGSPPRASPFGLPAVA